MERRNFLALCAGATLVAQDLFSQNRAEPPKLWIDPRLARLPKRPWRKVHLDFHNSQHVPRIGEKFDAGAFARQLVEASVDSIVVFAKDMHGYFYYPSKYGPVHPGLDFDLLGAQVDALRKHKIAVYAYYCTTWDNYLAEHHPEWLVVKRDRSTYLPKFDQTPGWTALCISHRDFVQLVADHTREFVSRYALDGAWFDMPVPIAGECFCRECLRQIRARGLDPFDTAVQRRHKQELETAFLKTLHSTVNQARPGCQLDYNGQAVYGLAERIPFMDNIDLEALPSGAQWGYYYFPLTVRYTRTFGVTTYGMTGRFKATWADFGGLKLPNQLIAEVASIVANGARCDIGDQMPPNARLDPAVYHVIGKAFAHIKSIEPYLEGAAPVAEAAMLISGLPLDWPSKEPHLGLTKLMMETRLQFDCVEPDAAWERYRLIVLPESLEVDPALAARLHRFVASGGAVIACHTSGKDWLSKYGIEFAGLSKFKPAYLVPREDFTHGIPTYEYALYEGASQWRISGEARAIAQLGEPLFQRSPEKYTSHRQSPFDHETEFAAAARSGRVAVIGFPLGSSYFNEGYWVYRSLFAHVLKHVLPEQLVTTNAPVSAEVEVTRQKDRYLVHIVNWSANRGSPKHPVFHEEPVPLADVRVGLRLPLRGASARAVVSNSDLPVRRNGSAVEVVVPRVGIHEIVAFET
jgi:hypothetical protein